MSLLYIFVIFIFIQYFFEKHLAKLNRDYYLDKDRQKDACDKLSIAADDLEKSISYADDKYKFSQWSGWVKLTVFLAFLVLGGFGFVERMAVSYAGGSDFLTGLYFFGLLGAINFIWQIPFSYYSNFVVEEKHGFNRQTKVTFVKDLLKGLVLAAVFGGIIISLLLYIMDNMGANWWLWAWVALSGFSIFTAWAFPTFIAPLFNKFSPLDEGDLKNGIFSLAKKVDFDAGDISVMDASIRSSHGNAYFTGLFGKKKIVLFDTLIEAMSASEVVAVLAHELGHFKLNHVRWMLIRSVVTTGLLFYGLSLCINLESFYHAFSFDGISSYAALVVFPMWYGLVETFIQPLETYLSRRNEFAADAFALENIDNKKELGSALLKLRSKSKSVPLSHPWFSAYYHSHPPMLERLAAMGYY